MSRIQGEVKVVKIKRVEDVTKIGHVMAFTRHEAQALQCSTVAQSQGLTHREVTVIRINKFESPIYQNPNQIVVACTRHTHKLIYYTVDDQDGFARFLLGGGMPQSSEYSKEQMVFDSLGGNIHRQE